MTIPFLLDTCVLSETSKPRPHASVVQFLKTAENLLLPVAALVELQCGISKLWATNPVKAVKLSAWYQQLISGEIPIVPTDREVGEVWGTLKADPRLAKHFQGGQDLHIAAAALVRRAAIATLNVKDFLLINSCYPLLSIYDPAEDLWHARMEPLAERYSYEPTGADDNKDFDEVVPKLF